MYKSIIQNKCTYGPKASEISKKQTYDKRNGVPTTLREVVEYPGWEEKQHNSRNYESGDKYIKI